MSVGRKTEYELNTNKQTWLSHVILVLALLCIGFGIVAGILAVFGGDAEKVRYGWESLAFEPVYNRSGSWFHGRLNMTYRPDILLVEQIFGLLVLLFLMRFLRFWNVLFRMKNIWLYAYDFGIATTVARGLSAMLEQYTLDYIYISDPFWRAGRFAGSTYDLFDFYLGIMFVMMILWLFVACVAYYRMKKRLTKGYSMWQKVVWEWKLTGDSLKAVFLPTDSWKAILARYHSQKSTDMHKDVDPQEDAGSHDQGETV